MTDQASDGMSARRTRRQLLAGGTGALAAVLTAGVLVRPAPAAAANGDNVILGALNTATGETVITNSSNGITALNAQATGSGIGLQSASDSSDGVLGDSGSGNGVEGDASSGSGAGVLGANFGAGYGVHGWSSGGDGVFGTSFGGGNGVTGHAKNSAASGVYGQNDGAGYGVAGRAAGGIGTLGDSANGVGVWANSDNATALKVTGKATFSRSGILTVAAGKSSATQTGVALTSTSLVLATLQQARPGVWVSSAVPTVKAHSFTVHLSKTVTAKTKVAWFVIN
jgi:hypothetical protein